MNRTTAALMVAGLVLAGLAASTPAAQAATQRLAVSPFQGPGADQLRAAVIARLPRRLHVLPPQQIGRADAVLEGAIWTGDEWKVRLVVRSHRTGLAAGTLVWSGSEPRALIEEVLREAPAKLEAQVNTMARRQRLAAAPRPRISSTVRRQVLSSAGPAAPPSRKIFRLRPAATAATPDQPQTEHDDAPAADDADTATPVARAARGDGDAPARPLAYTAAPAPLLEVSVGAGTIGRTLTFADNLAAAPGYSLPVASTLGGELVVYPGARLGGWAARLGLAGAWESSIAASTAGRGGDGGAQSYATRHVAYSLGARGQLPFRQATLLAGLDLGGQHFDVDLPGARLSPSVHYRYLRPSLGGRVALDQFALSLSAGYLHLLSTPGLGGGDVFPRAEARGFELGARLAYAIADDLAVELRLDFRRFAHAMNARPGDAMLVGGAVDDYLAAALRLSYRVW